MADKMDEILKTFLQQHNVNFETNVIGESSLVESVDVLENNVGSYENDEEQLRPNIEFDKEIFLSELQSYRCIWDVKSTSYKDRNMKTKAWKKLGEFFKRDGKVLLT